ncbi:hypothetical protein B0T16DRAFT_42648 [Cercophora newfieldiana]|uniref:Uncharacterized protein n=1 Tax=Cercophora newfieldiana TaxID=92897 RepID=A0AA39YRM1_9PEZI|nr:hypothetical protein B0T16DRAFT_42648 [Cercophora newfieldiana]
MDATTSISQLLALDDADLGEHMTQHRDARGRIDITHIKDWDDASETEQIQLSERFCSVSARVQVRPPIDIDQLFAKLDSIDATGGPFSREIAPPSSFSPSQEPARSPTRSPEPNASKAYQVQCYRELVDVGGRPPVALELLDEIYLHHAQYVDELRPWLAGGPVSSADDLGVFSRPLERWRQFQRWRRDNRGGSGSSATTCSGVSGNWRPRRTLTRSPGRCGQTSSGSTARSGRPTGTSRAMSWPHGAGSATTVSRRNSGSTRIPGGRTSG